MRKPADVSLSSGETDEEIIADLEKQIAEGRELEGYEPIEARVPKKLSVMYSVRLSPEEYAEFSDAAKARGMTMSDFMRAAARSVIDAGGGDQAAVLGAARAKLDELAELISQASTRGAVPAAGRSRRR
jgi:hypothetical protein